MILTEKYDDALQYASRLHRLQMRKSTEIPYISHLIAVSSLVLEQGGNEDEAIAGLLHDAVEDQGGEPRLEEIRNKFGENVANIVDGCTDSYVEPKPPWRERKEGYIADIRDKKCTSTLLVSACDKLHNARAILADYRQIGDEVYDRFTASKADTLWYYTGLVEAFKSRGDLAVFDELGLVVQELQKRE